MKKVKSIRFFSVFLSLSILLGLCPMSATAEADQTDHVEQPQIPVQTETVDNTSTYVIPNGTYYIKNRGNGSYLHAPTASFGKALLRDYQNSENQKWTITQVANGKYFITSAQSGALAISGSTPTDGAFVYTEPNMAQPRFWWSIERTESGSFKIQCSTAASYDYVLKDGDTIANHHYAANGEYCDDMDYSDEWYILDKVFGLVPYYDSTIQRNEKLMDNIEDASVFAINVYNNLLLNKGIVIEQVGVPQYYFNVSGEEALADQCTLPSRRPCELNADTCGDWCALNHEKNVGNMAQQLYEDARQDNYIYIMWANREDGAYCNTPFLADDHVLLHNVIACVMGCADDPNTAENEDYLYPVINFLTIDQNTDRQNLVCMSLVLVHELAHTFQIDDVYDTALHKSDDTYACIMDYYETNQSNTSTMTVDVRFYNDIVSGSRSPFCSSCLNRLIPAIQTCNHEGNT